MTPKLPEPPARSMYGNIDDLIHAHAVACFNAGMERAAEICEQRAETYEPHVTVNARNVHRGIATAIRKEITP